METLKGNIFLWWKKNFFERKIDLIFPITITLIFLVKLVFEILTELFCFGQFKFEIKKWSSNSSGAIIPPMGWGKIKNRPDLARQNVCSIKYWENRRQTFLLCIHVNCFISVRYCFFNYSWCFEFSDEQSNFMVDEQRNLCDLRRTNTIQMHNKMFWFQIK